MITAWARSKSVDEYLDSRSTTSITVCDGARRSVRCSPASTETLHWGYEDPAKVEGSEEQRLAAFDRTLTMMATRIGRSSVSRGAKAAIATRGQTAPCMTARPTATRPSSTCCATPMPATRRRWTGPDEARPLSGKGEKQSRRLGKFLAELAASGPDRSSPRRRCVRARRPSIVAEELGVEVDGRRAARRSASTPSPIEAILFDAGEPEQPVLVGPRSRLQRACRLADRRAVASR